MHKAETIKICVFEENVSAGYLYINLWEDGIWALKNFNLLSVLA